MITKTLSAAAIFAFVLCASLSTASAEAEKPALDLSSVPKQNAPSGDQTPSAWIVAVLIAGAAGGLILWSKRRADRTSGLDVMRVLAERSVGPKTRLVLLEARGREILLSVSDKGAERILDWWSDDARGDTADLEPPEARVLSAVQPAAISETSSFLTAPDSEVVSGIRRLKMEKVIPEMTRRAR